MTSIFSIIFYHMYLFIILQNHIHATLMQRLKLLMKYFEPFFSRLFFAINRENHKPGSR